MGTHAGAFFEQFGEVKYVHARSFRQVRQCDLRIQMGSNVILNSFQSNSRKSTMRDGDAPSRFVTCHTDERVSVFYAEGTFRSGLSFERPIRDLFIL